jgi:putative FmdB family regulatory protein
MPLYVFRCDECQEVKEIFRKLSEDVPQKAFCPSCDKKMRRDFNNAGFILKGDDWPGKAAARAAGSLTEKARQTEIDNKRTKRISDEVMKHRRQGRRHWKEWKAKNKDKVKEYAKGLKRGIRPQ